MSCALVTIIVAQLSASYLRPQASSAPRSPGHGLGATGMVRAARCPDSCSGRGICFDFGSTSPTMLPFPAICACDELWEGRSCNRRQHNPYHSCRERADHLSWTQAHGVSCSHNTSAASCAACASTLRLCREEGECVVTRRVPIMQCEARPLPSQRKRGRVIPRGAKLDECGVKHTSSKTGGATGWTPRVGRGRAQSRGGFERMTSSRSRAMNALAQRQTQLRKAQQLAASASAATSTACRDEGKHEWCLKKLESHKCSSHKVSQQCQLTCKTCPTARDSSEEDGSSNGMRAGKGRGAQFTRATIGGKAVGI